VGAVSPPHAAASSSTPRQILRSEDARNKVIDFIAWTLPSIGNLLLTSRFARQCSAKLAPE
jgi:hypothetical protein